MSTTEVLVAVIFCLLVLQGVSVVIIYKLVSNLSEKIALPLYNQSTRSVQYVRPDAKKVDSDEDANLKVAQEESVYQNTDELTETQLYKAALGGNEE